MPNKGKGYARPVSLAPLSLDEALRKLIAAGPIRKEQAKPKRRKKSAAAK
jgi:hypothetical protein